MSHIENNDSLGFFNDPMQDGGEGSDDELAGVPLPQFDPPSYILNIFLKYRELLNNHSVVIRDNDHKTDQTFFKTMVIRRGYVFLFLSK